MFRALSDPARRRLLDRLNEHNGLTLTELCADMGMTRQSVSKHLDILESAGVVTTLRQGREKRHYLNAAPINDIADRWIRNYDRARAEALSDLKTALEANTMDTTNSTKETTFVYTTYIHATPEQVWQGLTDRSFTKQYWRHPSAGGVEMRTDWKKGSTYDITYEESALVVSDPEQVILESDPYRRLAYTWHTFTPEWAAAHGVDEDLAAEWGAEPRSKVAFDIEDGGNGVVKLTVVHDGFEPGSAVLQGVSGGWPAVISALKTLVETGSPMPSS
ncbi:MAG TPA: metalloregulator ArsR/SmtB family transcription factor [Acidimicrobiales bacterium]|nr:metalloregulator ArsR/SmtB family transcription factor [Acidimicrobiales bacterium]